jgi:predicted nucleotidyltransferase component of viral defense system
MISYEEIQSKAEEFEIHTSNVQRDYVFGWLISGVAAHPRLGDLLVLKGGNALRKGYFPATRFSDDLDYSTSESLAGLDLVAEFNDVCRRAQEASGIEFELERNRLVEEQQLDDERRAHKLRLYFRDFTGTTQEMVLKVRVDVTDFDRLHLPVQARRLIHAYSDADDCSNEIRCIKLEEALADKLRALLQRQYSHDLFDLVYGVFINNELDVNRVEIVRTFLAKGVFGGDSLTPRELLLGLPFELMRGFWDRLVMPRLTRFSFEDAVSRFTGELAALFAPFAVPEQRASGFFPADYRAAILEAGTKATLLDIVYGGITRRVEPYSLVFKRRQDGAVLEYFYAWDRVGGRSGPGIKAFIPERVQAVSATEEQFDPRFPIELTKSAEGRVGYFARPFARRRSPARRGEYRYRVRCPYCGKIFPRKRPTTKLNPHKDGYRNRCPGRIGSLL